MKKLSVLFGFLFLTTVIFAQEDANFYKNEGNTAYKEKNYQKAFESYAKAIDLLSADNMVDTALIYNAGYCAYKSKQYDKAKDYFIKSADNKYKASKPYQYLISIEMKLKDLKAAENYALKGIEVYPNDAKLANLAAKVYLKQGLVFYNEANSIKKAANESGMNKTNPEAFKAEYAKADEQYKKALPLVEKAFSYDTTNEKVKKALKNVYISLDMTDKADAL
ncbi:MAG: hypothetical protein GXO79_08860, partial [Chlorobi bacterium]|nr:hypothetical protein [Chlorobiota bacterium]